MWSAALTETDSTLVPLPPPPPPPDSRPLTVTNAVDDARFWESLRAAQARDAGGGRSNEQIARNHDAPTCALHPCRRL